MVRVQLNTFTVTAAPTDTPAVLLTRYAVHFLVQPPTQRTTPLLPPEAFRMDPASEQLPVQENQAYTILSLWDELPYSFETWQTQWTLLKSHYPSLSDQDHFFLFLLKTHPNMASREAQLSVSMRLPTYMPILEKLGMVTLLRTAVGGLTRQLLFNLTPTEVMTKLMQWDADMTLVLRKRKRDLDAATEMHQRTMTMTSIAWDPFVMDRITMQYLLNYFPDMALIHPFQEAILNEEIPYLALVTLGRTIYKVHASYQASLRWIQPTYKHDGLYFHIHGAEARWSPDHVLEIEYPGQPDLDQSWQTLTRVFQTHQPLDVKEPPKQIRVKGNLYLAETSEILIQPTMLADVLATEAIGLQHFLIGESEILWSRKSFYQVTYVEDTGHVTPKHLRLKALLVQERIPKSQPPTYQLKFQISGAPHVAMVSAFQSTMGRLLPLLQTDQEQRMTLYTTLVPTLKKVWTAYRQSIPDVKVDRKTQPNLAALQLRFPGVFLPGYARACGAKAQPIILDPKDVPTYKAEMGLEHVLEFTHPNGEVVAYGCQTLENFRNKVHTDTPYPGLKINDTISRETLGYDYLPCCFKKDQYTGSTNLVDYIREQRDENAEAIGPVSKRAGLGYVVAPQRIVVQTLSGEPRYGRLPDHIQRVYINAGAPPSIRLPETKTDILPILRMGVLESPSSLLHALETVLNHEVYSQLETSSNRIAHVDALRRTLVPDAQALIPYQQEFGAMTLEEAYAQLMDLDEFLDPRMWYRLMEDHYAESIVSEKGDKEGVHLFFFELSLNIPEGDFLIPHALGPWLHTRKHRHSLAMVVHHPRVIHKLPQCELIVQIHEKTKGQYTHQFLHDVDSNIDIALMQTFTDGYRVYLLPRVETKE